MSGPAFFPGFTEGRITAGGAGIRYVIGGSGPPLLLVHGAPESGTMWHKVAAILRDRFTLVVPDLRGYGRSDKPASGDYTKRAMAADMAALMSHLGFDRFGAAGHDRGARVVRRLMKDHPSRVERGAVLDIVPTKWIYDNMDAGVAIGLWNWVMFVAPNAERILNFTAMLEGLRYLGDEAAVDDYLKTNGNPESYHAMCEDYRAGYHICRHQDADDAGIAIAAPLLVLWGEKSATTAALFDVPASWAGESASLSFASLPCGHFIPEELPEDTARLLGDFFSRN